MTIDERLEKLVERHEVLAGQTEIMAGMLLRLEAAQTRTEETLARFIEHTDETMNRIAHVLESHENRISDLENPQ